MQVVNMNDMNTQKLLNDFPRLYSELDYFECGDDLFETIYELSSKLNALALKKDYKPEDLVFDEGDGIFPRVTQVKVKYGGLRFYAYALTNEMRGLISEFENSML